MSFNVLPYQFEELLGEGVGEGVMGLVYQNCLAIGWEGRGGEVRERMRGGMRRS